MPRAIRRVVTGHNAQGRAIFISDGPAPAVFDRGPGATAVTELWETSATPASNAGSTDPTVGAPQRLPPPKNGSKFRVVEYPPDSKRVAAIHAVWSAAPDEVRSFFEVQQDGSFTMQKILIAAEP